MANWSEMNVTTRTAVGLVVLALVGGGYVWQSMQQVAVTDEPAAVVDLPKAGAVEPGVEPGAVALIAPVPDVVAAPAAEVIAPTAGVIAPVPEAVAVPVAEPPPAAAALAA
ncbi:MAG: hypothetical protein H7245_16475, partial [Candidatus Saccharibacteria bacterium]|nr:hypothetical protein [Pseudorhodobacter sp.]